MEGRGRGERGLAHTPFAAKEDKFQVGIKG